MKQDAGLRARLVEVQIEVADSHTIEQMVGSEAVHQGLLAECEPLEGPEIEDLDPKGLALVLDHITDPHNVGTMLRTVAAFGVEAVITTERHSPETSGVIAKAASGALEYVPIITLVNLARAMEVLKDKGVFIVSSTRRAIAASTTRRCARRWRWCSAPKAIRSARPPCVPFTRLLLRHGARFASSQ